MTNKNEDHIPDSLDYITLKSAAQVPDNLRVLLFEIENIMADSGVNFPLHERLFNELKKYKLGREEAIALVAYTHDRVRKHSTVEDNRRIYGPQYQFGDETVLAIPSQIIMISTVLSDRSERVTTFFRMADQIKSFKEIDGNEFSVCVAKALAHLDYIRGLDQNHVLTLAAIQEYRGSWDEYNSRLFDDYLTLEAALKGEKSEGNSDSSRMLALKEQMGVLDGEFNTITALRQYEKDHSIRLIDYFQFLINE